ncbi:hypothetical protein F8568_038095 [Actinomadura sp. LD22]|uniref:NADP-dependent oxidoreductase domain-containing protein n=1 Tax=Actinomadura physcomitrii TaxID=2650748 RepID=A0A6I4MN09_9ACTN|nr:hypothetical protein [Actinomadura physcomitrii]
MELGIAFVPYAPLGRGVLTGAATTTAELDATDERQIHPRFAPENARHNAALLAPVRRLAEAHGVTPAQVALAWLSARSRLHGLTVVPVPGTKRRSRLRENIAAIDIDLTDGELSTLEGISGQARATGCRNSHRNSGP